MPRLDSVEDLLVHELRELHDAERQILSALPRMARAASHPELRRALEQHGRQTAGQLDRIEQAMDSLGTPVKGGRCDGIAGLLVDAGKVIQSATGPAVKDAALIAAAQKVEHYEIASYGCVCTYAEILGYDHVHELLGRNLDEEETTDQKLMALSESVINQPTAEA